MKASSDIDSHKNSIRELNNSNYEILDNVIQDFAPEIAQICQFKEDEAEEQQVRTGQLHEHRILGILLMSYLNGVDILTTAEVEDEYIRYYREITRTTVSTYLNTLKKATTLCSRRDGRNVYYFFNKNPPETLSPFWFTRLFCSIPAYFDRAVSFCKLYTNANMYVDQFHSSNHTIDKNLLENNFRFIVGIIILNILKNRILKCIDCQFSKKAKYIDVAQSIDSAINDRTDILPKNKFDELISKCSELPTFNGISMNHKTLEKDIVKNILESAEINRNDIEFQVKVSHRRKYLRLKQTEL